MTSALNRLGYFRSLGSANPHFSPLSSVGLTVRRSEFDNLTFADCFRIALSFSRTCSAARMHPPTSYGSMLTKRAFAKRFHPNATSDYIRLTGRHLLPIEGLRLAGLEEA